MAFNADLSYLESSWQMDADFRDADMRDREAREMQDVEIFTGTPEQEEAFAAARREAAESAQWPITCDGSGILEEYYIDVDQTEVIECKGCPACDFELAEFSGAGVRKMPAKTEEAPALAGSRRVA